MSMLIKQFFNSILVSDFTCDSGEVIPIAQFCDGRTNCDGSDEIYASSSSFMENTDKTR